MMNMDTIVNAYNNGYRTKDICCAIAANIAADYNIAEEDYNKVLGDVYDDCMIEAISDVNIKVFLKMEEIWDEDYFLSPRRRRWVDEYKSKTTVFIYPSEDGYWNTRERRPSRAAITISSDGEMSMVKLSGVDPTAEQVAAMVTAAASKSLGIFCYDRRKRKFAFNIEDKTGPSGCKDIEMIIYEKVGEHYCRRRYGGNCLHISMAGKISDFGMYLGDALEILNWYTDENYRWAYYKMYTNTERRLRYMGIRFSRPPKNMDNIIRSNVTFDPTR